MLPGAELAWGRDPQTAALTHVDEAGALAAYVDHGGSHDHGDSPLLTLYAATPDGRRLYVPRCSTTTPRPGASYRSGTGWRDAGRDAALIPAGVTEVRVTPSGGAASTEGLSD